MLVTADRALFEGLIDYAGLFPPALLGMDAAVAEYRAARGGPHAWLLGRFICPASRLVELSGVLVETMAEGEAPWGVSVILDGEPGRAAAEAQTFDASMKPAAAVSLVEARLPGGASDGRPAGAAAELVRPVAVAALSVSTDATPFLEVAVTDGWQTGIPNGVDAVDAVRRAEGRLIGAKVRCGGTVAAAFPTPRQVARFIAACTAAGLPYKATAGLHHPVRHPDPELGVMRHGFLNVLFAGALAAAGADEDTLVAVIEDTDPGAFEVGAAGVRWRGEHVGAADVRRLRHERFAAYGSCSFTEPIEDLVALGLLERAR